MQDLSKWNYLKHTQQTFQVLLDLAKKHVSGGLPVTPEVFQLQKNSLRRGIVDVPFLLAESFI